LVSWLTLVMVVVTSIIVIMRYVFDAGFIWLQESVTWMHAAVFMLGAAYTLQQEQHVRVDIFYRSASDKGRAWTDLIGVTVFLLPLCGLLHEASRESGGLPYPLIPILKTVLLFMPVAVGLQGVSLLTQSLRTIRRT